MLNDETRRHQAAEAIPWRRPDFDLRAWANAIDDAEAERQREHENPLLLHCSPMDVWVALAGVRKGRSEAARANPHQVPRHITVCPSWSVPEGLMLVTDPLKSWEPELFRTADLSPRPVPSPSLFGALMASAGRADPFPVDVFRIT